MTSDPHQLGELGPRFQPLGNSPSETPRLRPYQSSPSNSQPAQHTWHTTPPVEPFHPTPPLAKEEAQPGSNGYLNPFTAAAAPPPAPVDPFTAAASPNPAPLEADPAIASGLHRALNAIRSTVPLVQRLLPLFESNIATAATAITALVAPQPTVQHIHHPPPPAPVPVPVEVDLEPIERGLSEVDRGLAEVRTAHRELRTQVAEQTTAIKRFEDQLEHVREATDRNTLEQQELVEDLRTVGSRLSTFAIIGLVILVLSLLINVFLVIQMQHILR